MTRGGKGRGGPRQPLSQRKPGVARRRAGATPGTRQKPPTSNLQSRLRKGDIPATQAQSRKRKPASRRIDPAALGEHARAVYETLLRLYPDAHCELDFSTPWQLLVATILSAQCTDRRVNMVTPSLHQRWPGPGELAAARQEDLEDVIRSTGFFRSKAKNLIAMANAVVERHGGDVPSTMDALVSLPGVGRKTANVVLGNAWGINAGVVVDTHVQRLSARLGLTSETDPVKIEQALMKLFDSDRWTLLSHLLIWHGRRICDARRPRCGECVLAAVCPAALVA